MGRKPKPAKSLALRDADIPPPHNQVYTGRDPEEDRLMTTLMLASEMLAEPGRNHTAPRPPDAYAMLQGNDHPTLPDDFAALQRLVRQIETWAADERAVALLHTLREAFGDGNALRLLFRHLFPDQVTLPAQDAQGHPLLSPREIEVLREAAGDRPNEEIGGRLGISTGTVRRHLHEIYTKLGIHRPIQAAARAVAMGYLDMDVFQQIETAGNCAVRDFGALHSALRSSEAIQHIPEPAALKSLAEFGLLLMTLSGLTAHLIFNDYQEIDSSCGVICEVNKQGKVMQTFGQDSLPNALGIAVAPSGAKRQGFTPGNLFVLYITNAQHGMNNAGIAEYTPEGQFVGAFCGARELSARLIMSWSLAFDTEGRLLVTTGSYTDAILAFRKGGAEVERFAYGCFTQLCVAASGEIYATQYSGVGCIVKVFDARGRLLQTLGGTPAGVAYTGIAVNSEGHVFVNRLEGKRNLVEEYDAQGNLLRPIEIGRFHDGRLAMDAEDNLYFPCAYTAEVNILSPDGTVRRLVRDKIRPCGIAAGNNRRLWICGEGV